MIEVEAATPSTGKVRRDVVGGKRGDGHRRTHAVRRPDPLKIEYAGHDATLSGVGGLVVFGRWLGDRGLNEWLERELDRLKPGPLVIYRMPVLVRMLLDAIVAGADRVFALEQLAADPLFVHLAGGVVPSLDTVYRALAKFDAKALVALEERLAYEGLYGALKPVQSRVFLDIDTSVLPVFGSQEGALPGPNPRYHGRPSYHPILARIAETRAWVGAFFRSGDTSLGGDDVPTIVRIVQRVRRALRPDQELWVRIDAGGEFTELLEALGSIDGVRYVVKARFTKDLAAAIRQHGSWESVDVDANDESTREVAQVVGFRRPAWRERSLMPRVAAVRTTDDVAGKQRFLWDDLEWTSKAYVTNDWLEDADDLARIYEDRAGIESAIAELKNAFGLGKVPSALMNANHAMFLLKMLATNLMHAFAAEEAPEIASWQGNWLRRALILVPARTVAHARKIHFRVHPASRIARMLN
jgi:hypothetical protein